MTTLAGAPVVAGVDGSARILAAVGVAAGEAALRRRRLRIGRRHGGFAARPDGTLGSTTRHLAGRTCCPLAIVPAAPSTRERW
jgi:hypothetical protein